MAILQPCLTCHRRAVCPIKAATHQRLLGSGITKARLKCALPEADFPAGSVVMVKAFEIIDHPDYYQQTRKSAIERSGVVAKWLRHRATVILDKNQEIEQPNGNPIAYLRVPSDRLSRIDAPLRELCQCGLDGERCINSDHPSVREGEWNCAQANAERAYYP